jgi:hypothetical protein
MALEFLSLSLCAHYGDRIVPAEDFEIPLRLPESSPAVLDWTPSEVRGQSVVVQLLELRIEDFTGEDPHDEFAQAITQGLESATVWLNSFTPDPFPTFHQKGLHLRCVVEGWMTQDQLDLDFPPAFLRVLGEKGIRLQLITNE